MEYKLGAVKKSSDYHYGKVGRLGLKGNSCGAFDSDRSYSAQTGTPTGCGELRSKPVAMVLEARQESNPKVEAHH
ncbi:hypothetical protein R1flu_005556 [Riccia fluitans]|uniref:Uncharacterized protein n=1 Tax=Riccia fluitans TaxID=41844 RepID=A0ABD1YWG9_9MARC